MNSHFAPVNFRTPCLVLARWLVLFLVLLLTCRLHASVSITEFLAANDGGLQDEDSESPDWIEIYNSGPGAVNLGGWHLTDDSANLTKWTLPAMVLLQNNYLVVFASGKNRAVAGSPLHTNFKLGVDG